MFMYMYILYTILILHVSQKALNINILYNVRETVMKQKTIFKNQTKTHKKVFFIHKMKTMTKYIDKIRSLIIP